MTRASFARHAASLALLATLISLQTGWIRASTCATFDEWTYLKLGYRIFKYGDFACMASPMAPPLPILLEYWLPSLRFQSLPDDPTWEAEEPTRIREARFLTATFIGVPLVWAVYLWMAQRRGWLAATLAGLLVAFSPTVLASAAIATTDACFVLFAVLALGALWTYHDRPSRGTFGLLGVALGLALAAKQSAVVLIPSVAIEVALVAWRRRTGANRLTMGLRTTISTLIRIFILAVLAFGVDWALYGFGRGPSFQSGLAHAYIPVIIPMVTGLFPRGEAFMDALRVWRPPLAWDTLEGQLDHAAHGHPAFLMGQRSNQGWWYFFPVAIAIKSTPAELLMFGSVLIRVFRRVIWVDPARRVWLGASLSLLAAGMKSSINIGQRYMLLIYPLLIILTVDLLASLGRRRPRLAISIGLALVGWQATSALSVAPHELAYFNSFCGGPSEGYRYLVDSSLDWGQDLPSLRRELEARGYRKVAFMYFGTASERAFGLRSIPYSAGDDPVAQGCDFLAISATSLTGTYGGDTRLLQALDSVPSARAGYSIFIYDLKDPKVREAVNSLRR